MNGLELRERINHDESLRKKSIPFVFLTTASDKRPIHKAFVELNVQGYFTKPNDMNEFENIMSCTLNYWQWCLHPNS
jgi:response regulator RpfG family c-di-GMP phosphodiesterase